MLCAIVLKYFCFLSFYVFYVFKSHPYTWTTMVTQSTLSAESTLISIHSCSIWHLLNSLSIFWYLETYFLSISISLTAACTYIRIHTHSFLLISHWLSAVNIEINVPFASLSNRRHSIRILFHTFSFWKSSFVASILNCKVAFIRLTICTYAEVLNDIKESDLIANIRSRYVGLFY